MVGQAQAAQLHGHCQSRIDGTKTYEVLLAAVSSIPRHGKQFRVLTSSGRSGLTYLVGSMRKVHTDNVQADCSCTSESPMPSQLGNLPLRSIFIFAAELVFGPEQM